MSTTTIVIVLLIIVILVFLTDKKKKIKELNFDLKNKIKLVNENPSILSKLSYNELVELEEALRYYFYQGRALVSNVTYDRIKLELEKKNKRNPIRELNENMKFIVKSINENPEIISHLSYKELVELEEVLSFNFYQGRELVNNVIYDKLKNELLKKKNNNPVKELNENPEILSKLSYNELVELEKVLSNNYYEGQSLVKNEIYDKLKLELEKKKNNSSIKELNENTEIFLLKSSYNELLELEKIISYNYYQGKPIVSNEIYDKLKVELSKKKKMIK